MKTKDARATALAIVCLVATCPLHGQDAGQGPEDFSKTNSVTILLVEAQRRNAPPGQGLAHHFWERDGRTTIMDVEGVPCRALSVADQGRPKGYLYFSIDPTFKSRDISKVRIDVEYFDGFAGKEGVFGLQYDTTSVADGVGMSSKQLYPNVPLKGSGKWLKTAFHVRDATFQNAQNGRADFRLWVSPPELSISRVTVTLEPEPPPEKPLTFDATGQVGLREWNLQWDSGSQPVFTRTNQPDGPRWLKIRASDDMVMSGGSWRTSVLLEPGVYQFVSRVLTTDIKAGPGEGVRLRVSGRGAAKNVIRTPDGTFLFYEFTMSSTGYVELVCEFLDSHGSASFDLDSLKLIRKGDR